MSLRRGVIRVQRLPMRIKTLTLLLLLAAATPALADEKKESKEPKDPNNGQYVNVSPVAAPIVLHGQLINYIFVTVRLDLFPGVDTSRLRDKEPYFRDALVRAAHRTPFVKPGDYTHVNEPMLKAVMLAEGTRIAGPHTLSAVEILTAQPQKVMGLPKGDAPPAARAPIP